MARQVLETLRVVTDDASDIAAVLKVMNKLADDGGGFFRVFFQKRNGEKFHQFLLFFNFRTKCQS